MLTNNLVILYNPAGKSKEHLKDEFVVRLDSFDRIMADITAGRYEYPEQHYLIVGQRGSGKTTLLHRIKYAIEDDPGLKNHLIPINLGEEQYQINSLLDLWESIADVLEDYHDFKDFGAQISGLREKTNQEGKLFESLAMALDKRTRRIVLLVDNFGELLKKFSEIEVKRLREILMTKPHIRLIAGTPVTLESVFDYSQPFFEFFKILELKGLSNDETRALLVKLSQIHNSEQKISRIIAEKPERIEILRRLTGGVIRTMVLLFKIFTETEDGTSIKDLQLILDSLTPLYKHRMDDLPTQQQKIVDVVAKSWDAIGVKEISAKTRIPSKVVSAQLRQLEKNQIISKVSTDSKNHLYQLKERFFNIWYLMRYGRKYDRKRVIWLVLFFEAWCDKTEMDERVQAYIESLVSNKYDIGSALLMGEAYASCRTVSRDIKERLIDITANLYPLEFDKTKFDLDDDDLDAALKLLRSGLFRDALAKLDEVKRIDRTNYKAVVRIAMECEDYYRVIRVLKIAAVEGYAEPDEVYLLAQLNEHHTQSYEDAIEFYRQAKDRGYELAISGLARVLYKYLDRIDEAKDILLSHLNVSPNDAQLHHEFGHLYGYKTKEYDKAVLSFEKSIALGKSTSNFCLAALYHFELKDFDKALKYYQVGPTDGRSEYNLGALYAELKNDHKNAIKHFELAAKFGMFDAYYELGRLYEFKVQDFGSAISYYELAYKEANERKALHRIAHAHAKSNNKEKAIEYFRRAIQKGDDKAMACLASFFLDNKTNRDEAIELITKAKSKLPNELSVWELSANIMLWSGRYNDVFTDLAVVFKDTNYTEKETKDLTDLLIKLMAQGLYFPVLKLFQTVEYKLTDILKPVYFSLMSFLKTEFPNETLKMGEELKETVNEILAKVELLRKHQD